MRTACRKSFVYAAIFVIAIPLSTQTARTQETPSTMTQPSKTGELEEIIVSARKREESVLNVPVIETAISQAKIETMQTVDVTDLATFVPGLDFGRGEHSIGTQVSLRGIGTSSYDQGVDSSVALYVDGLAPGSGIAFESGLFDLGQIEVLKGPQALFFGKSTPGGVISLRTADPTDKFEVSARASYEVEAQTNREEAIISGPVTDTLKLRLAGMYSTSEGYFYERAAAVPGYGGATPTDPRVPDSTDYVIRGTALWEPNDQLDARLKVNLVRDRIVNQESSQLVDCPSGPSSAPLGIPFLGVNVPCHLSRNNYVVWMDPTAFPGIINNGVPVMESQQQYGTLELNYRPGHSLTLTSLTSIYQLTSTDLVNAIETQGAGPTLAAEEFFRRHETTQELRLNSDFSSPLNFTVGAYYEDGLIDSHVVLPGNTALGLPAVLTGDLNPVTIKTYSAFGQLRYLILPKLELAAGLRYTDEKRHEDPVDLSGAPIDVTQPTVKSINTAPEITLTYRPTDALTAFAAYKQAYKSGSFSLATPPIPGTSNAFGEEKAQGGEVGLKSRWLEHRLAVNAAAYYYNYSGLQVGAITPAVNGQINIATVNAGAARSYGLDLDASYNPVSVDGLNVNTAVNFNHARYLTLDNVPCWAGQTIAAGCNQIYNTTTSLYTAQNLNGTPMIRAPNVQLNFGLTYDHDLPGSYKMQFSNTNYVSTRYVTFLAIDRPNNDNYQGSFIKSDLSLSLNGPGDGWEVALVVKNVGDKLIEGNCNASATSVGVIFPGSITGGTTSGIAGPGEEGCFVDPGREIWLRLTVKFLAGK